MKKVKRENRSKTMVQPTDRQISQPICPSLNRRNFVAGGLTTLAIGASLPLINSFSSRPFRSLGRFGKAPLRLKMTVSVLLADSTRASAELFKAVHAFADGVRAKSNGEVEILVQPDRNDIRGMVGELQAGELDLGIHSSALRVQVPPAAIFFGGLPFGLSPEKKRLWLTSEEGRNLRAGLSGEANLRPLYFGCGNGSFAQLCRRPIAKLSDLKGLKVAAYDRRANWFQRAGSIGIAGLSPRSVLAQLQDGTVDLIGPFQHSLTYDLQAHRLGFSYLLNPWFHSCYTYELLVAGPTWRTLSPSIRTLIEDVATLEGSRLQERTVTRERSILEKITAELGQTPQEFPQDIQNQFRTHAHELRRKIAKLDSFSRQIFEAYSEFEFRLG